MHGFGRDLGENFQPVEAPVAVFEYGPHYIGEGLRLEVIGLNRPDFGDHALGRGIFGKQQGHFVDARCFVPVGKHDHF